ncbi:hypothetical protein LCI18_007978 [Fusarium solani-melongenae]|uniref:Uncharacterized protein n=1 Tax=Fusarium solani subsp. cucurbitae TaxID=2747967 RepID=A0ACD3Z713_FUSSC|nr:hypothetical protein LCI18_007978 [Fusarium solani-melongenae]
MGVKVKVKPPKAKASKSKDRRGSEESEQGEASPAGTDPGGYEEWLGRNTGATTLQASMPDSHRFQSSGISRPPTLGNFINAAIVVTSKGYGKLSLIHIFLVYSSRPRIKIWFYTIFRSSWSEEDYSTMTAYFSLAVVEVILHIMSATFIGVTWSRYPNEPIKKHMSPVTMYMQVAAGILVLGILLAAPIWRRSKDPQWLSSCLLDFVLIFLFFGAVYAAPWAYWRMFLQLPGPLWCPPKIAGQGVIWVIFSTLSRFKIILLPSSTNMRHRQLS